MVVYERHLSRQTMAGAAARPWTPVRRCSTAAFSDQAKVLLLAAADSRARRIRRSWIERRGRCCCSIACRRWMSVKRVRYQCRFHRTASESRSLDHVHDHTDPCAPACASPRMSTASPSTNGERMAAVLDGSRVELIDGYLVKKMPE